MMQPLLLASLCLPSFPVQDPVTPLPIGDGDGHAYRVEFFPGATHNPGLTPPEQLLGQPVGSRAARPAEVVQAFETWASESKRVLLFRHGTTYEGRPLLHAIVTSEANHERLEEIRAANARLADPRGLSAGEAEELIAQTPAVAWMGYSIHGDETSGTDAALALGYHLAACEDAAVTELLDEVVIVLDPMMNPDGRARIVSMVEQSTGHRASLDRSSMARGRWPYGRGNHYLFDMNRDWMVGVAPETRARWSVLTRWLPQLFVDAHEMSGYDTFLMYPQAPARNPALPTRLLHWQGVFADEHGAAFDEQGWGYYTREWADAWYPGYSDAWGSLTGAIGMLYEQGRNQGMPLMRRSGEVVAYREAVHGQLVASLANLRSLAEHRAEIRTDWFEHRRAALAPPEGEDRVLALPATNDPSRLAALLRALLAQGVEARVLDQDAVGRGARGTLGEDRDELELVAGTYLIPLAQPQGALVRAYLQFDPRIDDATLGRERARLERGEGSNIYDVTAWDLSRQFGLEAYWCTLDGVPSTLLDPALLDTDAGVEVADDARSVYAFVVDASDDRALAFAARALERGLRVHVADKAFSPDTGTDPRRVFPRGSLLLRRHESPAELLLPADGASRRVEFEALVGEVAAESGVVAHAVFGGRAPDLEQPDLGGGHFGLLALPKVALLAGPPLSQSDYGHVWQYLDEVLRVPVSLLEAQGLGGVDLRRYNVLVVPPGRVRSLLREHHESLGTWVRSGGTLIALGSSAAALADPELGLGSVVRRSQALERLDEFEAAARRRREAGTSPLDPREVWGDGDSGGGEAGAEDSASEPAVAQDEGAGDPPGEPLEGLDEDLARADALARAFMPAGAILRGEVDVRSWLTVGAGAELPLPYAGSTVLLSTGDVPVRIAKERRLRLGGLIWPEARERLADGAWLARERAGYGQVIYFASSPVFRGSWRGTARLLGNAVVLGPGLGASQPTDW